MKTCPICNALTFDDAAVCYGCMHRFGEDEQTLLDRCETEESVVVPLAASAEALEAHSDLGGYGDGFPSALPPEFCIKMIPNLRRSGGITWSCSVELAPS